jgi:hypothetical protein
VQVPIVVRGPGGVGKQLGAEHSQRLESYFQSIPGVQIVACSTVPNSKALLKAAIRSDNPVIFFEHVLLYNLKGPAGGKDDVACLEKAELVREGSDCVIFTYSRMRWTVMHAVGALEKEVCSACAASRQACSFRHLQCSITFTGSPPSTTQHHFLQIRHCSHAWCYAPLHAYGVARAPCRASARSPATESGWLMLGVKPHAWNCQLACVPCQALPAMPRCLPILQLACTKVDG